MLEYFELGRILKPQGVKGEVKAELYTDDIKRINTLSSVYLRENSIMTAHKIVSARTDGSFVYLFIEGIPDRNAAEKYRNVTMYIDRSHAAPLEPGSFYIADLIGLELLDESENVLGKVSEIYQNGCTDIYEVRGESDFLFPGIPEVFIERNPEEGFIKVDSKKLSEISVEN